MGWNEVNGIEKYTVRDFSAGWFAGKDFNEIPGDLRDPSIPTGAQDTNAMIWFEGELQKMFGYDNVNTSALNSGANINGLFYSYVLDEFVATAGSNIYSDANTASPTDISGAISLNATALIDWDEWQFETDKYIIGVNGTDNPFKWTGSGNAAALGGSPPAGTWVKVWQNAVWIANTSTEPSTVFFSNLADPETWTADDDYKFDAPITGMAVLGNKLVVFKENSIGILSGSNNRILIKVDKYINGIGCSGGHTIANCKIQGNEVLVFHSNNGIYAFDGSTKLIKLSSPIDRKYTNNDSTVRWNDSRFNVAGATYSRSYGWYVISLSDGGDSTNDFVLILDLNRVYQDNQGLYVPHWPIDAIDANVLLAANDANETIYFGGTDGFVYEFTPNTYNYNGSAYEGYFESKTYDPGINWVLQETNVLGDSNSVDLEVSVAADLDVSDGETGIADFTVSNVLLDAFVLNIDVLGGIDTGYVPVSILNFGRFFKFKVSNDDLNEGPHIKQLEFVVINDSLISNYTA